MLSLTSKTDGKKPTAKSAMQRQMIVEFLTAHPEGTVHDFEKLLNVKSSRVKEILYTMVSEDIVEGIGEDKNRFYRLKL